MKLGAVFWMHRTTWPRLREAALKAERAGFDSLWFDDHFLPVQGDWRSPKFDGWTLISAVAALTNRPSVGLLVSSTTFRNPALMAKMAVTLDHVSAGRAVLGIGSGYYEREHRAFGIDFGSGPGERLDRMDEAAMIIRRLLDGETFDHEGRFYRLSAAIVAPRPLQERLPILIGGVGRQKTLRTVARYADMWNAYGPLAELSELALALDDRCREIGRDPGSIERTVIRQVAIRDDRAKAEQAWQAISAMHLPNEINFEELEIGGSPPDVAMELARYRETGFGHVICVFRDPYDYETMERMGEVRRVLEEMSRRGAADSGAVGRSQ
jgi:alkanesulfonate monooxygenase SsuD/methylene tetrahydromethanopterin reductase-like flavin-dependent oxidoreductase (luciferase family)